MIEKQAIWGLFGVILGMIIEGIVRNFKEKIDYKKIVDTVIDTPLLPNSAPHPVLGHVEYKVVYVNSDQTQKTELYTGYDSDEAYKAWMELERNPEKYPGHHAYFINGQIHSQKLV